MVFYAAFNIILNLSWQQLALFMSLGSEVSCPWALLKKIPRIQCGSHSGSLDYKSNTLPLSHTGSLHHVRIRMKLINIKILKQYKHAQTVYNDMVNTLSRCTYIPFYRTWLIIIVRQSYCMDKSSILKCYEGKEYFVPFFPFFDLYF